MVHALGLSLLCGAAFGPSQATAKLDEAIEKELAAKKIPGVSVAVSQRGKILLHKGYGYANIEHKTPMKADAVHELASVSKQFTAAGILLLVQEGKLSLDETMGDLFKADFDPWKKITVRHLLNHTSGLPDYLAKLAGFHESVNETKFVGLLKGQPLRFEPGSKWEYSNSGYAALGFIIAMKAQKSLGEFMEERLWKPLNMRRTRLNSPTAIIPDRADGYSVRGTRVFREGYTSPSLSITADGHVMSSASDLVKWTEALMSGKVVSETLLKEMLTPTPISAEGRTNGTGYGYGINISQKPTGPVYAHSGGWMGTSTFLMHEKGRGLTVAVLCNADGANIQELVRIVAENFSKVNSFVQSRSQKGSEPVRT